MSLTTREPIGAVPPGVLVRGPRAALQAAFPALIDLQPVSWSREGLICAPRAAPDQAAMALARCPFPIEVLSAPPAWPEPAARLAGGWYVRSPEHLPAPLQVPELIEARGEGFGPLAHTTTAAALSLITTLPAGSAVDVGCGSGLLTQAWLALDRGPVHAIDLDARAVAHAHRGLVAAGLDRSARVERLPIAALRAESLGGRVLLANLPLPAHLELLGRISEPPLGILVAGVRRPEVQSVLSGYGSLGLHAVATSYMGRWGAWVLRPRPPGIRPPHE